MKIKFTPSPNQLRIKHLIRNSKKQKFLCDIYISLNRILSDRIDYGKQFRIRNPIRHSLPITPSDRIFYPKPFRIKNPIRRGFLKKTLSDRVSYPKPFRIKNPIRIAQRVKSRGQVIQPVVDCPTQLFTVGYLFVKIYKSKRHSRAISYPARLLIFLEFFVC